MRASHFHSAGAPRVDAPSPRAARTWCRARHRVERLEFALEERQALVVHGGGETRFDLPSANHDAPVVVARDDRQSRMTTRTTRRGVLSFRSKVPSGSRSATSWTCGRCVRCAVRRARDTAGAASRLHAPSAWYRTNQTSPFLQFKRSLASLNFPEHLERQRKKTGARYSRQSNISAM